MTARTLKIKIKLGNGDSVAEPELHVRRNSHQNTRQALHTIPGSLPAETRQTRQRTAPPGKPAYLEPRLLAAAAAVIALLAVVLFGLSAEDTASTPPQLAESTPPAAVMADRPAGAIGTEEPTASATPRSQARPSTEAGSVEAKVLTETRQLASAKEERANAATVTTPTAPAPTSGSVTQKQTITAKPPALAAAPSARTSEQPSVQSSPATPTKSAAAPATPPAASNSRNIGRAQLTSAIQNREPTDQLGGTLDADPNNLKRVFFFTELLNLNGRNVTHRWEFDGQTVASVKFKIGSQRWRTYSSKYIAPDQVGQWQVTVLDDDGKTLHTTRFAYGTQPR